MIYHLRDGRDCQVLHFAPLAPISPATSDGVRDRQVIHFESPAPVQPVAALACTAESMLIWQDPDYHTDPATGDRDAGVQPLHTSPALSPARTVGTLGSGQRSSRGESGSNLHAYPERQNAPVSTPRTRGEGLPPPSPGVRA